MRTSSRARTVTVAGALALVAGLQYLLVEVVVASAWTRPAYDWAFNLVPDLGNSSCGPYQDRVVCSPLHTAMNTGFVVHGLLFGIAGVLLAQSMTRRARTAMTVLAAVFAIGLTLTAVFHQYAGVGVGRLVLNITGAGLAILAGNAMVVTAGRQRRHLGLPSWLGRVSTALGLIGIVAGTALFALGDLVPPGVRERVSIYPFVLWQLLAGAVILRRRR